MSSVTRYIGIGALVLLVGLTFWNRSLSASLNREQAEKAKALQEVATLQQTVDRLTRAREADDSAAAQVIRDMGALYDKSTEAAISIERVPSGQCPSIEADNATKAPGSRQSCDIDMPLPALSLPLVMLHKELSHTGANGTSARLDGGDQTSARTASHGDDRPSAGAVGKGATGGSSRLQEPS